MHPSSADDATILAKRIRLLYSQSSAAVLVGMIVASLTAYYLWQGPQSLHLIGWVCFLILSSLGRLYLFRQYSLRQPEDAELDRWLLLHVGASFAGGVSWGLLGLFYDPGWATGQQVALFVVIAGMSTAAISSYAASLLSYSAFLVPMLSPLFVRLLTADAADTVGLWLIVPVFAAGLFAVARNFNTHIVDTIRLAVEQESLQKAVLTGTEQLKETKRALHSTEARFAQVLESSLDGFWDWDIIGETLYFSPRYKQQLGFEDDELPNEFSTWESRLHPEDRELILAKVRTYLERPWGYWEEEFRLRHKDGSYRNILARGIPTLDNDAKPVRLTGVHIDITDRVRSERKVQYLAYHDWLTKLPNRALFNDRLEHALAQAKRADTRLFILFIDLDQFKHINDSLGHPVGDKILQKVARRLCKQLRRADTVARLSGDEFSVLLENMPGSEDVVIVAEKILNCLKQPFFEEGLKFSVGASIGISVYPGDGGDVATLLKNADAAMYRAKKTGRNQMQFYSKELTSAAFKHIKLEYALRQALSKEQFQVYYQPKLCLETGRVLGAEALLRWQHPEDGFISPQEFIPVAEDSGLIKEIGDWVLRQACLDSAGWKQSGLDFEHIAINISGVQIQHFDFVQSVRGALELSCLPPQCLELEITENFLMKDAEVSAGVLDELRNLGISIAIDDFGTGYSSLAYLARFPVNKLKIDRSFITRVCLDEQNAEISRAIIDLGHSLDMRVVAEGIETEQQLDFLKDRHCDEGQGYLFARPLPPDEFVSFLKQQAEDWPSTTVA